MSHQRRLPFLLTLLLALGWTFTPINPPLTSAGDIVNDPKGFHGIQWGASLANVPGLTLVQSLERVDEYEIKEAPLQLGDAKADSVRFFTIDGGFGRVTIRYRGKKTHDSVLAYLQSQFGPADRTPGSMMRGLNQQFNWRGADTEVNLTYEAKQERGHLFIESRTLSPRFSDALADTGSGS
ncbi:MAG: hypothetical protein HZA21_02405 [Nitrospirae bacterium]|nr:hypothetical protein [Nitrospirota bacterium]